MKTSDPRLYRLQRYGLASAPFQAIRIVKQLCLDEAARFLEAARVIGENSLHRWRIDRRSDVYAIRTAISSWSINTSCLRISSSRKLSSKSIIKRICFLKINSPYPWSGRLFGLNVGSLQLNASTAYEASVEINTVATIHGRAFNGPCGSCLSHL